MRLTKRSCTTSTWNDCLSMIKRIFDYETHGFGRGKHSAVWENWKTKKDNWYIYAHVYLLPFGPQSDTKHAIIDLDPGTAWNVIKNATLFYPPPSIK